MRKINYRVWTWGMRGLEGSVKDAVEIINKNDWSEKDAKIIQKMFKDFEDFAEDLKESAYGRDS